MFSYSYALLDLFHVILSFLFDFDGDCCLLRFLYNVWLDVGGRMNRWRISSALKVIPSYFHFLINILHTGLFGVPASLELDGECKSPPL
jgi:hypothetical protein